MLRISHRRSVASMPADPDARVLAAGDDQVGQRVAGHGRRACSGVGVALVDNGEQDCGGGYFAAAAAAHGLADRLAVADCLGPFRL